MPDPQFPFSDDMLAAFQEAKRRAEEPAADDDGTATVNRVYLRALIDLYRAVHRTVEGEDT